MTTSENTNSGSNVTTLSALADIPRISVFDDLEDLRSLASVAETVDASTRFDATDFPAIANTMVGVESPTPVANAAIAAMDTPSILKSVASIRSSALAASTALDAADFSSVANAMAGVESPASVASAAIAAMDTPLLLKSATGVRNSALVASAAFGTIDTPAFHDAVSSIEGITASVNAATDFEQSIELFSGPSALAGAADTSINAPHEESTESPVDTDFKWSVAKCAYHSVRLYLKQVKIPMTEKLARNLFLLSYGLAFLHVYTAFSLNINNIVWIIVGQVLSVIVGQVLSEYRNRE